MKDGMMNAAHVLDVVTSKALPQFRHHPQLQRRLEREEWSEYVSRVYFICRAEAISALIVSLITKAAEEGNVALSKFNNPPKRLYKFKFQSQVAIFVLSISRYAC